MLLGRRRLLLRRAATEVNRSIFQKQTLERPSSNGGRGSEVDTRTSPSAFSRPVSPNGHLRSFPYRRRTAAPTKSGRPKVMWPPACADPRRGSRWRPTTEARIIPGTDGEPVSARTGRSLALRTKLGKSYLQHVVDFGDQPALLVDVALNQINYI